jgi:hypothetical protein
MIFTQTAFKAKIAELETENAALTAQLATSNSRLEELTGANERIIELETEATAAQEAATAAAAQISTLEAAAATHAAALKAAEESAAAKAIEIAAAAGITAPLEIEGGDTAPSDHITAMSKMNPVERAKYFRANKKAIMADMQKTSTLTTI